MIEIAKNYMRLSRCEKRPVGCVVVKGSRIISYGYNHGLEEKCTCEFGKKNPHVIHAEAMALCGSDPEIYEDAVIYVTYTPCIDCMALIKKMKLSKLVYLDNEKRLIRCKLM